MRLNKIYKGTRLVYDSKAISFKGYGHYLYVVTNILSYKRYIGYYTGYPTKEEIYDNITERPILEDIYKLGKDKFHFGIVGKFTSEVAMSYYVDIEAKRYSNTLTGVYNKGYSNEGLDNRVICIDNGKDFKSSVEAGEYYDIDASSIRKVCNNKRKSAGGYRWAYYKDVYK